MLRLLVSTNSALQKSGKKCPSIYGCCSGFMTLFMQGDKLSHLINFLHLQIVVTLALAVSAESEADAYHVYGSPAYPSYYSGVSPYYNQYKPAAYYNSHYYGASPYAYRYRRDAEAEPEADSQVYMTR
jgi:hypothetical protein